MASETETAFQGEMHLQEICESGMMQFEADIKMRFGADWPGTGTGALNYSIHLAHLKTG